ncbi:MAG: PVC-type heme-binding CxxCH protein [Planctomycetaceae bacterium]
MGDRILIFEDDTDGDGKHDKRTVFYDQLNYVTGIEVGFGGAWVMSPPNFYFIPDRDADDRPDSAPVVFVGGFEITPTLITSPMVLPGDLTAGCMELMAARTGRRSASRVPQQRNEFVSTAVSIAIILNDMSGSQPFADGTTNPWGIDWDDFGQAFVCNCVDPHLYHVIQGAHYEPWRNRESSRYAYQRITTIADHLHFIGKGNVHDGTGTAEEDAAGVHAIAGR